MTVFTHQTNLKYFPVIPSLIKEYDIQRALQKKFDSNDYHLCNSYVFDKNWESDYMSISNTGYVYEVEIKISRADFFRDFAKDKHHIFQNCTKPYLVVNKGGRHGDRLGWKEEGDRKIQYPVYAEASGIKILDLSQTLFPNRFYYACPDDILQPEDIPSYAGLLYVGRTATIIKPAPLLHRRKLDLSKILMEKFYWKMLRLQERSRLSKDIYRDKDKVIQQLTRFLENNGFKVNYLEGDYTKPIVIPKMSQEFVINSRN